MEYQQTIAAHGILLLSVYLRRIFGEPQLSEPIYDPAPFLPGKRNVEAEVREMPRVLRYCTYPASAGIVDRAYRFVMQKVRMEKPVSSILTLVDGLQYRLKVGP